MEETLIPLNDTNGAPALTDSKRQNSFGSDKGIELCHEGDEGTLDYRINATDQNDKEKKISLWHDISLNYIDPKTEEKTEYLNFVCEIPKFTR